MFISRQRITQVVNANDPFCLFIVEIYLFDKVSFNKTDKSIKEAEREALSFKGSHTDRTKHTHLSQEATELARRMNRVGLNDRSSYNYDKYGKERKLPAHQYSLIGDILRFSSDNKLSHTLVPY
jgi:hypothetical protein